MVTSTDPQPPLAERLTGGTIAATWLLWLVGGLYLAGPVLGWTLALLVARAYYLAPALPEAERPEPLPPMVLAWLAGMLVMLVILFIGHANFHLGTGVVEKAFGMTLEALAAGAGLTLVDSAATTAVALVAIAAAAAACAALLAPLAPSRRLALQLRHPWHQ